MCDQTAETYSESNQRPAFAPVDEQARIQAVDILRGFALLGILGMNIYAFAMPFQAYENPAAYGGTDSLNYSVWTITELLFSLKFMGIFSMLFGAGLYLMFSRAQDAGKPFGKIYMRRLLWLFVIGMIHAYFIWWGDILVGYAVCGVLIFLFRKKSVRALIIWGLSFILFAALLQSGSGIFMNYARSQAQEADRLESQNQAPSEVQLEMRKVWNEMAQALYPSEENIQKEIDVYRDGYLGILKFRTPYVIAIQTQSTLFFLLWRVGGIMLLGIALMKLRIFSAERSRRLYLLFLIGGYLVGIPIVWYGHVQNAAHAYDTVYRYIVGNSYNYFGSLFVMMGHVGVVMLFCKSNLLGWLKKSLAAVGRMALTNYLMHSIIFTSIFYGYGLGLFGKFDRFHQMLFALAMWTLQLLYSPLWLKYFRFGPFEWAWRSLTYWKIQPLRK